MNNPKVTIIIPTVCSKHLEASYCSAIAQTHQNTKVLVVFDGENYLDTGKLPSLVQDNLVLNDAANYMMVPENTGANNFNGHRIYAATSYLVNTDFICWLDEDNWFEENHVQKLVESLQENDAQWAFSYRNICDKSGEFICKDECESLGNQHSVLHTQDFLVDVSCFLLTPHQAICASPLWYRRARQPGVVPADRSITQFMLENFPKVAGSGEYSVNYRLGSREDSVQVDFFIAGNDKMSNNA